MKKHVSQSRRSLLWASVAVAALTLTGCATRVKAGATTNPPPTEAFAAFSRIELKPVASAPNSGASPAGVTKIHANLVKDLSGSLANWNQTKDNGRKLVIEPIVQQMQFKGSAMRVLFGPFAGSSGVLLELKITDGEGKLIASPQFFQRADAWAAGFVLGVHDNLMLTRVANLASGYVIDNYSAAKGGPTGADDKALARQ
ncbi:MAG: hypothetical protein GXC94_06375 [Comamonadaceae bacterium]|jgi:hypothetical protein|nr:hypothetical protein [Comamonadaceae bacterium]